MANTNSMMSFLDEYALRLFKSHDKPRLAIWILCIKRVDPGFKRLVSNSLILIGWVGMRQYGGA